MSHGLVRVVAVGQPVPRPHGRGAEIDIRDAAKIGTLIQEADDTAAHAPDGGDVQPRHAGGLGVVLRQQGDHAGTSSEVVANS
jgi:hypothetical protein